MTNFGKACSLSRGLKAALLAAFAIGHSSFVIAAQPATVPAAPVVSIESTRTADLVMLGHGFDAGLRQGMVCRVTRGSAEVAEVLLVDLRPACSAALILNVVPGQSIRPGDLATIKLLKT